MVASGAAELIGTLALVVLLWAAGALLILLPDRMAARQIGRRRASVRSRTATRPTS
jgi:hypothetical protein